MKKDDLVRKIDKMGCNDGEAVGMIFSACADMGSPDGALLSIKALPEFTAAIVSHFTRPWRYEFLHKMGFVECLDDRMLYARNLPEGSPLIMVWILLKGEELEPDGYTYDARTGLDFKAFFIWWQKVSREDRGKIVKIHTERLKFCIKDCSFLDPTEEEQDGCGKKARHYCRKYHKIVRHDKYHPEIVMVDGCTERET